jgi:hypothetical protein
MSLMVKPLGFPATGPPNRNKLDRMLRNANLSIVMARFVVLLPNLTMEVGLYSIEGHECG